MSNEKLSCPVRVDFSLTTGEKFSCELDDYARALRKILETHGVKFRDENDT